MLKNYSGLIKLVHLTDFSTAYPTLLRATEVVVTIGEEKKEIMLEPILTIWRQSHPPKSFCITVSLITSKLHVFGKHWIIVSSLHQNLKPVQKHPFSNQVKLSSR